jgi:nucleoid DNA-binding protein
MAKNKTTETNSSVTEFIDKVENELKRDDSFKLIEIFKSLSGFEPKMWGPTIIGFGSYHYKYESGHEGDAPLTGFSPRKDALVFYFTSDFKDRELLLSQLGKHKSSKGCVYIKKLSDIDLKILEIMIVNSMDYITKCIHQPVRSKKCL